MEKYDRNEHTNVLESCVSGVGVCVDDVTSIHQASVETGNNH